MYLLYPLSLLGQNQSYSKTLYALSGMNAAKEVTTADIRVKRIYRAARNSDGKRILVDRLWPRGMSRQRARIDMWMKELAPSDALRQWFHAHPDRTDLFRERYWQELCARPELIDELCAASAVETVTLLYASKHETDNNATVLRDFIMDVLARRGGV